MVGRRRGERGFADGCHHGATGVRQRPRQQVLRDLPLAFAIVTFASTVKTAKVTAIRSYLIDLMA
jgi:hypothetical protein